ncbi:blastula protease 10-like [Daphnia pulicaria]|uniref:blastula protease 10-like n=1 Tax=Daphnia pulicaria TaxID=35523 RepID=UPI001EEC34FD|nr:blastula protease 10-like [Daphnia pulicaria]
MLVLTLFLTVITVQFIVFMIASFPLYVLTNRISPTKKSNLLLERIDGAIPTLPITTFCNVTNDCGECRALTDESGLIESQHFPNEYSGNLSCLFTIKAPIGKNVQLKFTEFNVNQCCDFITVFDGLANPLRVGLNGYEIPAALTSPSNQLIVKFSSNNNIDSPIDALSNTSSTDLGPARWQAMYTFV